MVIRWIVFFCLVISSCTNTTLKNEYVLSSFDSNGALKSIYVYGTYVEKNNIEVYGEPYYLELIFKDFQCNLEHEINIDGFVSPIELKSFAHSTGQRICGASIKLDSPEDHIVVIVDNYTYELKKVTSTIKSNKFLDLIRGV